MLAGFAQLPFPRADWHTHAALYRSVEPRASATIQAMVARGAELGLAMMGIGEHVNFQPSHAPKCYEKLAHDLRGAELPIPAFLGAEVDILDAQGGLSYPEGLLERTRPDYVIASVHGMGEYSSLGEYLALDQTLMMAAITAENGAHILGHPWHSVRKVVERGLVPEWRFEMIPEAMLAELTDGLRAHGVALEVNSRSIAIFGDPAYRAFLQGILEAGVQVAVGSDAHAPERLDSSLAINDFLAEMGFEAHQVWMPERARHLAGDALA